MMFNVGDSALTEGHVWTDSEYDVVFGIKCLVEVRFGRMYVFPLESGNLFVTNSDTILTVNCVTVEANYNLLVTLVYTDNEFIKLKNKNAIPFRNVR